MRGIRIGLRKNSPKGCRVEPYWIERGECCFLPRVATVLTRCHAEGKEVEKVVVPLGDQVLGLDSFEQAPLHPRVAGDFVEYRRRGRNDAPSTNEMQWLTWNKVPIRWPRW